MYPFWNPYYHPFMMNVPSFLPIVQPQMFLNPAPFVAANPVVSNDLPGFPEITKNTEKNTELPSKSVIDISSDSESEIQEIQPPQSIDKKQHPAKKIKPDRFLGFKEGIFEKENHQTAKTSRNLRKRTVLTRARLKRHQEKNIEKKVNQKKKIIQKPTIPKKLRQSLRISKNENMVKNRGGEKKPRNRQFGKLKKYLRGVVQTVDLPEMYTVKLGFLKQIEEKKENLLLRQVSN